MKSIATLGILVGSLALACGGSSGGAEMDGGGNEDGGGTGGDAGGGDGGVDDGCPAYHTLCGGECVPTAVDPQNCGDCGVECTGQSACSAGACSETCLGGLEICDNQCVDKQSDNAHCGDCGSPCEDGMGCVDGACEPALSVGEPADCTGGGSPPQLPDGDDMQCAGDLAETTFRWALCSCSDVVLTNPMTTDAFSSISGSYTPGGVGGGIGLNGMFDAASEVYDYGDLRASDTSGLVSTNPTEVALELHAGGPVDASGTFDVGENAFIDGNLSASERFTIAQELHLPHGASISSNASYGSLVREPVAVPPPCDCAADQLIPVGDIVTWGASNNDNAAVGLDPDVLIAPANSTRLDLPCGSYYLSAIEATSPMVIRVHGRTAIFIGGDIVNHAPLTITLDPDAELNIFVGGTIVSTNPLTVGSVLYPALTRLYVAGSTEITLSNPTDIGGFFYAAYGLVNVQNPLEVFGGVYAGDYNADNPVDIHYDREVLDAGEDCPDDPGDPDCDSCVDCGNQACIDGQCGECMTDGDCCAPLRCVDGTCVGTGIE